MENSWIWLIVIGGIVGISFAAFWWRRSKARAAVRRREAQPATSPVQEDVLVERAEGGSETAVSPSSQPTLTIPNNPEGTPWRILVVDDMSIWANTIRQFSTLFDCEVRHAARLTAAVQELARWQPHLIILDLHMPRDPWQPISSLQGKYAPDQKTLAFCEQVTGHPNLANIIVAITTVEEQAEQQAITKSAGAHYFFTKGEFSVEQFKLLLLEMAQRNHTHLPSSPS